MIKKLLIFLLVFILFVGSVFIVGYLIIPSMHPLQKSEPLERKISSVYVEVPIAREEVENINFTYVLRELHKINYSAENRSSPNATEYYIYSQDTLYVDIVSDYTINKSYLSAKDQVPAGDTKNEIRMNTQKELEMIAEICNISLNWLNAEWGVIYVDYFPQLGEEREGVEWFSVVINVSYAEVASINFTQASKTLNPLNFTFTNHTIFGSENIQYEALDKMYAFPPREGLHIQIGGNMSTRSAHVVAVNDAGVFPISKLKAEKEYLIERTNQVAKACNITLDWNKAEWIPYLS